MPKGLVLYIREYERTEPTAYGGEVVWFPEDRWDYVLHSGPHRIMESESLAIVKSRVATLAKKMGATVSAKIIRGESP